MAKRLCIRSDEAYQIATHHALRTGRPRTHVVYAALLAYAQDVVGETLEPREHEFLDGMRAAGFPSPAGPPRPPAENV
jgi:hypothetical protein